jgi:LuxR family glucitol operon transcriptional activator
MNELFSTTFISREIEYIGDEQDLRYSIPEFSKEYILKNHPIKSSYIKVVSERLRNLKISTTNIKRVSEYNEFGINALSIRNENEKVVARLLNDALRYSKNENLDDALIKIDEAKSILPNYAEIYRVSGFIKASSEDFLGAESDYKTGLEIEPENPRLLYFYGSFLLYSLNDLENAFIHVEKLHELRPESEYPTLLFARILSTNGDSEKSISLLKNLLKKPSRSKTTIRIINTDLIGVYSYWARAIVEKEGDFDLAISKFQYAIEIYEISVDSRNFDSRMTKAFCNVLKSYLKLIPKSHNQENATDISDLLVKYDDQISLNQSKEYLQHLLSNSLGIIRINQERNSGIIVTKNSNKFFAFISSENGKQFYANKKGFKTSSDFDFISEGTSVTFEIGNNKQGDCAINIEVK